MKKLIALLALLAALTGIGFAISGPTTTNRHHDKVALVAPAHVCTPTNETMRCLLPSAPVSTGFGAVLALSGKDFAWTKLTPAQAGSFGADYLSSDPSKNWNTSLIGEYHAVHVGTVAVFEEGGTQSLDGCARGATDARFAEGLLTSWGYPHSHFDMAIDFDAVGSQLVQIDGYFNCANKAEPGLVGAYGGYNQVLYLWQHHVVDNLNWQTYAWSGGLWLPASIAPLEQYLNGNTFDYDRALAENYGQFPSPKPIPVGPSKATVRHWINAKVSSEKVFLARKCENHPVSSECYVFLHRTLYFQTKLVDQKVESQIVPCWGKDATPARLGLRFCEVIRPTVSYWSHARNASEAVHYTKRAVYFQNRIKEAFRLT